MTSRKVISLKEVERAQKAAHRNSEKQGLDYKVSLSKTKVRVRQPIKRTFVFLLACIFAYGAYEAFMLPEIWPGIVLSLCSIFCFYVSFYGNRKELSECVVESGEAALEVAGSLFD